MWDVQECSRYNVTGDGAVVVNDDCPQRRRRPDVMQTDVDAVAVSQGRMDIRIRMRKRPRTKSYG